MVSALDGLGSSPSHFFFLGGGGKTLYPHSSSHSLTTQVYN